MQTSGIFVGSSSKKSNATSAAGTSPNINIQCMEQLSILCQAKFVSEKAATDASRVFKTIQKSR